MLAEFFIFSKIFYNFASRKKILTFLFEKFSDLTLW